jgi:hypothetical protein
MGVTAVDPTRDDIDKLVGSLKDVLAEARAAKNSA